MSDTLNELKSVLAAKLAKGCHNSIEIIQNVTPIDTQRLYTSVDATESVINDNGSITCEITLGGKELYGIRRDQQHKKPVNYALYVEIRTGFVRSALANIKNQIIEDLNGK
jgi:hypothetical protein